MKVLAMHQDLIVQNHLANQERTLLKKMIFQASLETEKKDVQEELDVNFSIRFALSNQ